MGEKRQTNLLCACLHAKSLQLYPTLCYPVDCSPPGSSVHGILQARILEWVAMPSSRRCPNPGIKPASLMSPALADRFFTTSVSQEAHGEELLRHQIQSLMISTWNRRILNNKSEDLVARKQEVVSGKRWLLMGMIENLENQAYRSKYKCTEFSFLYYGLNYTSWWYRKFGGNLSEFI